MGYLLEAYAMNWSGLERMIGSGDEDVFDMIVAAEPRIFVGSPGVNWKTALRGLILGERGRSLAARGIESSIRDPAGEEEAMAFVAIIRTHGWRAGELVRTSRGGDEFRAMFSPTFTPAPFPRMDLMRYLLRRPMYGLDRDDFPMWGGLRQDEVEAVTQPISPSPPLNPNQEAWLYELREMLMNVAERRTDLLTLCL